MKADHVFGVRASGLQAFIAILVSLPATVLGQECELSDDQKHQILNLPLRVFDQAEHDGWRPLYDAGCYLAAARLIEAYMAEMVSISERDHYMLPFHAGQMRALAGDYVSALGHMKSSYSSKSSTIVNWNAFVSANIAFLEKDKEKLLRMREEIDRQPALTSGPHTPDWAVGKKLNLDVVDGFVACFDESYAVAYSDDCRPQ